MKPEHYYMYRRREKCRRLCEGIFAALYLTVVGFSFIYFGAHVLVWLAK